MKLLKIRVQNYKKIRDTDWISCRDLTVFVGKNEAGKSALFRGLSKLNPSDGEKYDGLKEFPRRRYTDEFKTQDWPVASGLFKLSAQEQQELETRCPALKGANALECTRHYSWNLDMRFKPAPTPPAVRLKPTSLPRSTLSSSPSLPARIPPRPRRPKPRPLSPL